MGTQRFPDEATQAGENGAGGMVDTPRIGPVMWFLLLLLAVPPGVLAAARRAMGEAGPSVALIVVFFLPFFVMLLVLPRRYRLDGSALTIEGLFYRKRIPVEKIRAVRRAGLWPALTRLGSVYCSDPSKALEVQVEGGGSVIISPSEPEEFAKRVMALSGGGGSHAAPAKRDA